MEGSDRTFKLIILGDSCVGKTSILSRFAENSFSGNYVTTIGIDFKIRSIVVNGQKVVLHLWDTAGQEKFRSFSAPFFRGSHGALVVYDITDGNTFKHVTSWLQNIEEKTNDELSIIVVGNKCDDSSRRMVEHSTGEELALANGFEHFEVSAKTGKNIEDLFFRMAQILLKKQEKVDKAKQEDEAANVIKLKKRSKNKKKKFC